MGLIWCLCCFDCCCLTCVYFCLLFVLISATCGVWWLVWWFGGYGCLLGLVIVFVEVWFVWVFDCRFCRLCDAWIQLPVALPFPLPYLRG